MSEKNFPFFEGEEEADIRPALKKPDMYKVVMHNDNYTSMEFVVHVLTMIFHHPAAEATKIMLDIHNKGRGIAGIFTYDIAMTKIMQVHNLARQHEFPLKCTCEKE